MTEYYRRQLSMSELRDMNTYIVTRNSWYSRESSVFGIKEQPVHKSGSVMESIKRVRQHMVYHHGRWISKRDAQSYAGSKLDLMVNIDYWKKHGRLPDKNMAKVHGKGMYPT